MLKDDGTKRALHEAVRNAVGYYNFTHQLLEVRGKGAQAFLDYVYVNPVGRAKVGSGKYTTMLDYDGLIVDDVIVFRVQEDVYWVSTLYINELISWLDALSGRYEASYQDISAAMEMYAVQGPNSLALLNSFLTEAVDELRFFSITENSIGDVPVKVARSGYTGELGYELYCAPEHRQLVEAALAEQGQAFDAQEVTELDVIIGSLPTEKGYVLMSDIGGLNPLEAGFGDAIDWAKDFIGKEALLAVRNSGPSRQLVGFTVDDDQAAIEAGDPVIVGGREVGNATRFTYGYTLEKGVGYAVVDQASAEAGGSATISGVTVSLTPRGWYDPANRRVLGS